MKSEGDDTEYPAWQRSRHSSPSAGKPHTWRRAAGHFFCSRLRRGRGPLFYPAPLLRGGNPVLDVHSGGGPLCHAGLCHLPRHDGGAIHLGMAALGNAGAEGTQIRGQQLLLRGAERYHRRAANRAARQPAAQRAETFSQTEGGQA